MPGLNLETHATAITARWSLVVVEEVPPLARLSSAELTEHLAAFLATLARAEGAIEQVAVRHAQSRHAQGIELAGVVREYASLRRVVTDELVGAEPDELRQIHAAIDQAIAEAANAYSVASDHVRESFIGILAHDLRDPLTAVMMSATLLGDSGLGEKQRQLVERITRGARRIERMIDDVLDFARTRLGERVPIDRVAAHMGELVTLAIDEARVHVGDREIHLVLTGDMHGRWDRARVVQALGNLLSNARLYGRGAIRVNVEGMPERISTAVVNEGSVIPDAMLTRIFDPFGRAAVEGKPRRGLGLYIVAQIAKAHGGAWRAESAEERTTFTIDWPRA
jgi:signal transduction histidine kinase